MQNEFGRIRRPLPPLYYNISKQNAPAGEKRRIREKYRYVFIIMEFPTLMGSDWREVEPFWGNFPLQQRRTETLEGERFSYNFAAVEGSKRPNLFRSKNRVFDPSTAEKL